MDMKENMTLEKIKGTKEVDVKKREIVKKAKG